MKFMRLGDPGQETPCVLDKNGAARDISGLVPDISPETISGLTEGCLAL